jgi:hypothetical protein
MKIKIQIKRRKVFERDNRLKKDERNGKIKKKQKSSRKKSYVLHLRVAAIPTSMTRCFDYLGRNRMRVPNFRRNSLPTP